MRKTLLLVFLFFTIVISGCTNLHTKIGTHLNIKALETHLKVGKSDTTKVQSILGEPDGKGRYMFPFNKTPSTQWTYHYEVGNTKNFHGEILFIYFDNDKNMNGYLWLSQDITP
jgi:hypothetical protein